MNPYPVEPSERQVQLQPAVQVQPVVQVQPASQDGVRDSIGV